MEDRFGRTIQYLRISITDRCNLRCQYCMPEEGIDKMAHEDILSFTEIVRLVQIFAELGVKRIRLTGGEPLVRKGIAQLARQIKGIPQIEYLGITTNGILLEEMGKSLVEAGVNGANISLDTLDAQRYFTLTRRDEFAKAMRGIETALQIPFDVVKLNCVLAPQSQQEDWLGVVELAQKLPVDVRLIEWMPMAGEKQTQSILADDALALLQEKYGKATPLGIATGAGPAVHYQFNGFKGRVGIIPAMTHNFCDTCNRVRLTAGGELKLCLFYDEGISLRTLLRGGATNEEIKQAIMDAIDHKPQRHFGAKQHVFNSDTEEVITTPQGMAAIGG